MNINKMSETSVYATDIGITNSTDTIAKDATIQKYEAMDTYQKTSQPEVMVCECYSNYQVPKATLKSVFCDKFGYDMLYEIWEYMNQYYAGEMDEKQLQEQFEECCSTMLAYRCEQGQTSGNNIMDNQLIIREMYEVFAKQSVRAASNANYMEGEEVNKKYSDEPNIQDWVYYNAEYYYKCSETNTMLRSFMDEMVEKWQVPELDADEIEKNSTYTADGKFDFNSIWNFVFRNQRGNASIEGDSVVPPRDLKIFFKEYPSMGEVFGEFSALLKVETNSETYIMEVPFSGSETGWEKDIFNGQGLLERLEQDNEGREDLKEFMSHFYIFNRWYAMTNGVMHRFGSYGLDKSIRAQ